MRPSALLRLVALLCVLVLSLALTACGSGSEKEEIEGSGQAHSGFAETEGIYVEVDGLKYQVQISRQLNPRTPDDAAYLEGIPEDERQLGPEQEWFAIFMRVENDGEEEHDAAGEFEIHDTQENVYTPVELPETNAFSYQPATVRPGDLIPLENSPGGERPPYGLVILFKVERFSLDNRPLELYVEGPDGGTGIINLDV